MEKISSRISQLPDSEESEEEEEVDPEPWLKLWQPYNQLYDKKEPKNLPGVGDTFDIYIDYVRFVPDNISFCKISGGVYNSSSSSGGGTATTPNISVEAVPLITSNARCPKFRSKVTVNRERVRMNPRAVLVLRLQGLDRETGRVVLLGTGVVNVFDSSRGNLLQVGHHQIPVRRGQPGATTLDETSMDREDKIPALTLLIR